MHKILLDNIPVLSLNINSSNFSKPLISKIEFMNGSSVNNSDKRAREAIYTSKFISSRFRSRFADNSKEIIFFFKKNFIIIIINIYNK